MLFIFLLLFCVYYMLSSLDQYDDEEVEIFISNIPYIFLFVHPSLHMNYVSN